MVKLESYCDLRDAAAEAAQARKQRELEILAALDAIDPELVKEGLELWEGAKEGLANYMTQSIPAMGGATCYELLAAGERARVLKLFGVMLSGVYL